MRSHPLLALGFVAVTWSTGAVAATECSSASEPCVDAEPLWHSPEAAPFTLLASAFARPAGELGLGLAFTFRLRPAVLVAPSPNRSGREVNVIQLAADAGMGWTLGLGHGLELSGATSLGLYQRGAGFRGVTDQAAPPLERTSVHDPRFGIGYGFFEDSNELRAKARVQLKLPWPATWRSSWLGDPESLASEAPVLSPSLAVSWGKTGPFVGAEVGIRLRRTVQLFGSRIGSQAFAALGLGYAISRPRLSFTLEAYALPSLVARGSERYLPAEWFGSAAFSLASEPKLSFGLGAGAAIPLSANEAGEHFAAFGAPALRSLAFARFAP